MIPTRFIQGPCISRFVVTLVLYKLLACMEKLVHRLKNLFTEYPLSPESRNLSYGTPGYRGKAELFQGVAARIGAFACLYSIQKCGKAVGVMITASHNPPEDNGLKLIDTDGGMLSPDLEPSVVEFVRLRSNEIGSFLCNYFSDSYDENVEPQVYFGWDSRISSVTLSQEVKKGIVAVGGKYIDFGLVTTPQLHFLVHIQSSHHVPNCLEDYVEVFTRCFVKAFSTLRGGGGEIHLNVDCAHGVGALTLTSLSSRLYLASRASTYPADSPRLCLRTYNTLTSEKDLLNRECGADFVKIHIKQPKLTPLPPEAAPFASPARWATIDGDADRLLYFFCPSGSEGTSVCLLDGDRIAILFTAFIADRLRLHRQGQRRLRLGVVQTAYANAASTHYLHRCLGPDAADSVVCALTGVKHLHKAAKNFDFGVYFEANGHGTVVVSERAQDYVSSLEEDDPLRLFVSLVNTAVGDALTDLLLVEYVLAARGLSLDQWFALYHDLPSRQLKVSIADRTVIQTTDADRKATHPPGLQEAIDSLVREADTAAMKVGSAISVEGGGVSRAFVRPSGTEDVVRVYTESATQSLADWLAQSVARLVYKHANGVGPEPPAPKRIPV
ncbi:Phosphoacetylglucosamine mutase [Echinococcus granulosus]|uniref:Phosphoacetylglucosamine mutase n=2 Tax=Echinococcus granulosus TaxID=6210 RepID=A0A068WL75_ECHGR|nr:Phosphoacetylglucosamine mutase [Echinococcus granulosus]CDS18360.1 phosphoacetylglucosamine mutase [Echinococcus granulosus]